MQVQFNNSGWGLRFYISNRLQGDADIAGSQNTLEVAWVITNQVRRQITLYVPVLE